MKAAFIVALVFLGLFDLALVLSCAELEHRHEEWEKKEYHDR